MILKVVRRRVKGSEFLMVKIRPWKIPPWMQIQFLVHAFFPKYWRQDTYHIKFLARLELLRRQTEKHFAWILIQRNTVCAALFLVDLVKTTLFLLTCNSWDGYFFANLIDVVLANLVDGVYWRVQFILKLLAAWAFISDFWKYFLLTLSFN